MTNLGGLILQAFYCAVFIIYSSGDAAIRVQRRVSQATAFVATACAIAATLPLAGVGDFLEKVECFTSVRPESHREGKSELSLFEYCFLYDFDYAFINISE